jgi:hypothetical protein
MIALSFLRKARVYIPLELKFEIIFFIVVGVGALAYFLLIICITNKMKAIFNTQRTSRVIKVLGYILLGFSLYFLYYSIKLFFFDGEPFYISNFVA